MPFEHSHAFSVARHLCRKSPVSVTAHPSRRIPRYADEPEEPMFARRRQTKKLMQVARMLRELDAASSGRTRRVRRSRAAVSRAA
jgi:hypothetical protein